MSALIVFIGLCTLINIYLGWRHIFPKPIEARFVDEKPAVITLANKDDYANFEPGMQVVISSAVYDAASKALPEPPAKKSWFKTKWASWTAQAMMLCLFVGQACSCSTPSDQIVGPVDAAPDSAPSSGDNTLVLGQCWTRFAFVEGVCLSETDTAQCGADAERVTSKVISQTEHYSGGVVETYADECPEKRDFKDYEQVIQYNGCSILCAMRFDIVQQFQE